MISNGVIGVLIPGDDGAVEPWNRVDRLDLCLSRRREGVGLPALANPVYEPLQVIRLFSGVAGESCRPGKEYGRGFVSGRSNGDLTGDGGAYISDS